MSSDPWGCHTLGCYVSLGLEMCTMLFIYSCLSDLKARAENTLSVVVRFSCEDLEREVKHIHSVDQCKCRNN